MPNSKHTHTLCIDCNKLKWRFNRSIKYAIRHNASVSHVHSTKDIEQRICVGIKIRSNDNTHTHNLSFILSPSATMHRSKRDCAFIVGRECFVILLLKWLIKVHHKIGVSLSLSPSFSLPLSFSCVWCDAKVATMNLLNVNWVWRSSGYSYGLLRRNICMDFIELIAICIT